MHLNTVFVEVVFGKFQFAIFAVWQEMATEMFDFFCDVSCHLTLPLLSTTFLDFLIEDYSMFMFTVMFLVQR